MVGYIEVINDVQICNGKLFDVYQQVLLNFLKRSHVRSGGWEVQSVLINILEPRNLTPEKREGQFKPSSVING